MSRYEYHQGQAPGKENLCSGHLTGCDQGYVTNQANQVVAQVFRLITEMNNKDAGSGAYFQLKNCMSDKIKEILPNLLQSFSGSQSVTNNVCASDAINWQGWTLTTGLKGDFSDALCNRYKSEIAINGPKCESYAGAGASYVLYIVLPAVAALVIAAILFGCYLRCKNGSSTTSTSTSRFSYAGSNNQGSASGSLAVSLATRVAADIL